MAYIDKQKEEKLKEYITTRSNGRVSMHVFPFTQEKVSMRCNVCSPVASWTVNVNAGLTYGVDLDFINDFCDAHLHGSKPMPVVPDMANATIKEIVESFNSVTSDLTVKSSGRRGVSVTQEFLKWVSKQSNFNVNLQAFTQGNITSNYRAICEQCGKFIQISYEDLGRMDNMILAQWCREHRHDGSQLPDVPQGRKFRGIVN